MMDLSLSVFMVLYCEKICGGIWLRFCFEGVAFELRLLDQVNPLTGLGDSLNLAE